MARKIVGPFHSHGIPITWALYAQFPRSLALDITRWHDKFGDDVLLMVDVESVLNPDINPLDPRSVAEESVRLREILPKLLSDGRGKLQGEMPWAEVRVGGARLKNPELLFALRETGFVGLWGYDWLSDMDKPAPFGTFLISDDSPVATYPLSSEPLLGLPRSSVQLNRLIRKRILGDPLSQCLWAIDQYIRSAIWNDILPFVHELDLEEYYEIATEYRDDLEAFLVALREREIEFATLDRVTGELTAGTVETSPTYLLVDEDLDGGKILFYHDSKCRMRFEEDEVAPVEIRDYTLSYGRSQADFLDRSPPNLVRFSTGRDRERLIMLIEVESGKSSPYGLAVWGDFGDLRVESSDVQLHSLLGEHLLLLRMDVTPGKSTFRIVMSI